ncbi:hypothetical protein F5B22DRAFT_629220 [Xylaria bambusicola]|uniref:uncharacterized protein n=1 Tax=Xylaria bambusicola TaxID=326684 RepID=UPI002008E07D|nr:uncharacterized protein F5B22DRAFT_629220 [Xylaria bambusicola]KAI0503385.1 hypothetical protein F5B22DRAFT_629220 [Xylaria bambusicola]
MPADTEGPTVALSFANNFWGKDDAGVGPLLDRMASAKQTSDELRSFYSARASLEDDYARKLMSLSRKPLGSHEMGSLKTSLDTVRGEVESMAKQHANIAAQMKSELEEPLAAFAGGMKERRKIIQNTVEKILKVKIQQTHTVNKTRDRYEQDCLRIKGYLAQGHMVMGQEERKNKAKLEKTQISLASTNAEYESAVKALEDTTARWNREWKAAADKFQDLEEERLDFSKSSLWTFANLASTVCVSDDSSCEKIRLALEKMDVEDDIVHFIKEKGTGQEIPDPPKYINFCRGDVDDHKSDDSDEENYSVAQFPRSINPAFRTSSPQPSTLESHHDPNSALARELSHQDPISPSHVEPAAGIPPPTDHPASTMPPQNSYPTAMSHQSGRPVGAPRQNSYPHPGHAHPSHSSAMSYPDHNTHPSAMLHQNAQLPGMVPQDPYGSLDRRGAPSMQQYDPAQFSAVPHDPYPMDGMTMLCRTDGANSASNHKQPSRFDNMKPASIAPNVSSRTETFAPSRNSEVPARVEATNSASNSSVVARWDTMRTSATSSNIQPRIDGLNSAANSSIAARREDLRSSTSSDVQPRLDGISNATSTNISPRSEGISSATSSNARPRIDGLNSATSSNISARYDGVNSATSSNISAGDDNSEYSNPTSFSSQEPPSGKTSPVKPEPSVAEPVAAEPEKRMMKKKSGFFQNHSPFRRKSTKDVSKDARPSTRNTWGPVASQESTTSRRAPQVYKPEARTSVYPTETKNVLKDRTASPEPIDANASLALNVGQNVFPVANTDKRAQPTAKDTQPAEELDPIAAALAELKGAADNKQAATRVSADRYHGISTPIPDRTHERTQSHPQPAERTQERPQTRAQERPQERAQERTQERTPLFSRPVPAPRSGSDASTGLRGTPPPSYDTPPVQRLGVPPPAVTSKAMQESSRKYTGQTRQMLSSSRPASVYNSTPSRPATRQADVPRAASPAPPRSVSPRPTTRGETRPETRQAPRSASPNPYSSSGSTRPETRQGPRSASPNPYGGSQHGGSPQPTMTPQRGSEQSYYQANSPGGNHSRTASPAPYRGDYNRPASRASAMAVQLAPVGGEGSVYGSVRSRGSGGGRPGTSHSYRAPSVYDGGDNRWRSGSVADPSRQYTPEGRAILHYARALYMYQAAIPEELGFAKGDILAVLRHQDDGWWEAEIHSGNGVGQGGLVPSNYLQPC